jgi:Uncharacterised nucleotidyltransferase
MSRWDAFLDVCGFLRAGLLGGEPPPRRQKRNWELLIEISSFHLVTPSLAVCLQDEPIPREVRDYMDALLVCNGQRNALQLAALSRIVAALNAIDIEPVLLKGCARLVQGDYPQPNMRFLGDLDILVPANRTKDAYAALLAKGFSEKPGYGIPPDCHHLPVLHEYQSGAGVDIHDELSMGAGARVLSAFWFYEGSRPFRLQNDLHVRLPDATRSVCHNVAHNQLHHSGYEKRIVELRQLLDLALIRRRYEGSIDWAELDHLFSQHGFGQVLATYLQFGEELLGQKAPRLQSKPCVGRGESLRRIVDPPIASALFALLASYVRARRHDPLGVLRLLNPMNWPRHLSFIKGARSFRSLSLRKRGIWKEVWDR